MLAQLVIDNRTDPSHTIRSQIERRKKINHLISSNNPLLDSNGQLVVEDRRGFYDRRNQQ